MGCRLLAIAGGRTGQLPASPVPILSRRREVGEASARSLLAVLGEYRLPRGEPVWTAVLLPALALRHVEWQDAAQRHWDTLLAETG
jgi:hypothetical protein